MERCNKKLRVNVEPEQAFELCKMIEDRFEVKTALKLTSLGDLEIYTNCRGYQLSRITLFAEGFLQAWDVRPETVSYYG